MSLDRYELIPKLELLYSLCHENNIAIEPLPGHQMFYEGRVWYVLSSKDNTVALIDDMPNIPFNTERVVEIKDWENETGCLLIPRADDILEIIRTHTGIFPSMTPGVKKTREVWQIRHTEGSSIVSGSLLEGLIDMALEKLQTQT